MRKNSYIAPQSSVFVPAIEIMEVPNPGVTSKPATETDPVLAKRQTIVIEEDDEEEAGPAPVRYLYNPWNDGLKEW